MTLENHVFPPRVEHGGQVGRVLARESVLDRTQLGGAELPQHRRSGEVPEAVGQEVILLRVLPQPGLAEDFLEVPEELEQRAVDGHGTGVGPEALDGGDVRLARGGDELAEDAGREALAREVLDGDLPDPEESGVSAGRLAQLAEVGLDGFDLRPDRLLGAQSVVARHADVEDVLGDRVHRVRVVAAGDDRVLHGLRQRGEPLFGHVRTRVDVASPEFGDGLLGVLRGADGHPIHGRLHEADAAGAERLAAAVVLQPHCSPDVLRNAFFAAEHVGHGLAEKLAHPVVRFLEVA